MARLPNTATKEEIKEVHVAKMAGKVLDRARRAGQRTAITSRAQLRRLVGNSASTPQMNRHTGKPHDKAREIMRRTMSVLERRAFAGKVTRALGQIEKVA